MGASVATRASDAQLDRRCADTIRTLCIGAIEATNSEHPGTPIAIAPVTYTLWQRFLHFDPSDQIWPSRDRFVLSAGHASLLRSALLHLTEVQAVDADYEVLGRPAVSLNDPKSFCQLGSRCRNGRRRARRQTPVRVREGVHRVLERPAGDHRRTEHGASRLIRMRLEESA